MFYIETKLPYPTYLPPTYLPPTLQPPTYQEGGKCFIPDTFSKNRGVLRVRFLEPPSFAVIFFVVSEEKEVFTRAENWHFFSSRNSTHVQLSDFRAGTVLEKISKIITGVDPQHHFASFSGNLSCSSSNP